MGVGWGGVGSGLVGKQKAGMFVVGRMLFHCTCLLLPPLFHLSHHPFVSHLSLHPSPHPSLHPPSHPHPFNFQAPTVAT